MGLMKGTKKIGENEDGEACDSTLQIPHADSRKFTLTISSKKLDEYDDSVACDRILEISNLLGRNGVKRQFHGKSFKVSF